MYIYIYVYIYMYMYIFSEYSRSTSLNDRSVARDEAPTQV